MRGAGFAPRTAIGADGTAVVAWVPAVGSFGGRGIRVSVREADGSYGPAQDLETREAYFHVAVSDDGDAFIVWVADDVVYASVRPAGGVFGPPQVLETGLRYAYIDVASDAAGEAVAVWDGAGGVTAAVRPDGDALFGAPSTVAPGGMVQLAAADDAGVTSLAWVSGTTVHIARRRAGGSFGTAQPIGAGLPHYVVSRLDLAAHADGSLALLIGGRIDEGTSSKDRRWVATAPPRGRFRAPREVDLALSGDTSRDPSPGSASIGAVPGGRAVIATEAVVTRPDDSCGGCMTSVSEGLQLQAVDASGAPLAPTRAAGVRYAVIPRTGVDRTGTAVTVFDSMDGTSSVSVPIDEPPCPVERIATHRSIPAEPTLDAGELGMIGWQEIPSSNVHIAFHRPQPGCPAVTAPPEDGEDEAALTDPAPSSSDAPVTTEGDQPGATATTTTTTATPPSPTANPASPTSAAATRRHPRVATVAKVNRRLRTATFRLRCTLAAATPCTGRLRLLPAATASRTLGTARFSLLPGGTTLLRVRLTTPARKALRRGAVRARASVQAPGRRPRVHRITLRPQHR